MNELSNRDIAAGAVSAVARREERTSMARRLEPQLRCFGHRGAKGHEPENTLRSIEKALELGAELVEFDVHLVDGHLVVLHDFGLERTTNGKGYVSQRTFDYLRSLDAGKGQKIPTLQEVLDLVDRRAGINIEIKTAETAEPVVDVIDHYVSKCGWSYEKFLISSFNHHEVKAAKDLNEHLAVAPVIIGYPLGLAEYAELLGAYSIHTWIEFVNEAFVNEAHQRGIRVFSFGEDYLGEIERADRLGVDGVFTGYPERCSTVLRTRTALATRCKQEV